MTVQSYDRYLYQRWSASDRCEDSTGIGQSSLRPVVSALYKSWSYSPVEALKMDYIWAAISIHRELRYLKSFRFIKDDFRFDVSGYDNVQLFLAAGHTDLSAKTLSTTTTFHIRSSCWWCGMFSSAWLGRHLYQLQKWCCRTPQGNFILLPVHLSLIYIGNHIFLHTSWCLPINQMKKW